MQGKQESYLPKCRQSSFSGAALPSPCAPPPAPPSSPCPTGSRFIFFHMSQSVLRIRIVDCDIFGPLNLDPNGYIRNIRNFIWAGSKSTIRIRKIASE